MGAFTYGLLRAYLGPLTSGLNVLEAYLRNSVFLSCLGKCC